MLTRVAAGHGWQVRIAATSGWLPVRPALHGVRLRSEQGDLAIEAERIAISPWQYRLDIERPTAVVTLADTAEPADDRSGAAASPPLLPIGHAPAISLTGGVIELRDQADSLLVLVEGVNVEASPVPGSGEGVAPVLTVDVVVGRFQVAGDTPDDPLVSASADARLQLSPDRLEVERLRLEALLVGDRVSGQIAGALSLHEHLPAAVDLGAWGEDRGSAWNATALTRLSGTLSPLALRGDVDVTYADSLVGDMRLRTGVTVTGTQVTVDSARVAVLGGQLRLCGLYTFDADSAAVDVEATGLQIDRFAPDFTGATVGGRLRASVLLSRALYSGSLQARMDGVRAIGDEPGSVVVRGELSPGGQLSATVESDQGRLGATGAMDLSSGVSYDLDVEGDLDLAAVLGPAVSHLAVSGRLRPDDVQVQLRAAELAYLRGGIGPVGLDLRLREGRHLSASALVESDQVRAHLEADLVTGLLDTLQADVAPLPMDRILPGAGGVLRATLSAAGRPSASGAIVRGQLALANLQLYEWDLGDVTADLSLESGQGQVELRGAGLSAVVTVDTSGAVAGSAVMADAVIVTHTDTANAALGHRIRSSGRARWTGNLHADLSDWKAELEIDSLAATLYGRELRTEGPVRIRHEQGFTIDSAALRTPIGLLVVAGTLGERLDLTAAVDSLTPSQAIADLEGTGSARFELDGTRLEPRVTAWISLQELTLGGRPIGDFEAQLALSDSLSPDSLVVVASLDQPSNTGAAAVRRVLSIGFIGAASDLLKAAASSQDDPRATLTLEAVDLDATGPVSYATGDSLAARLSLRSEWSLSARALDEWSQAEGELEIERLDLGNAGVRVGLASGGTVVRLARGSQLEMPATAVFPIQRLDDDAQQFEPAGRLLVTAARNPGRTRVGIDLADIDLRVVEPLTSGAVELPTGTLDMSLVVADSAQGTGFQLTSVTYMDDLGELLLESSVSATALRAQAAWVTPVLDSLIVDVDVPWQMEDRRVRWDGGRLRARSDGINLFLLLDQIPQLQSLDGLLRLDVDIVGLADHPQTRGQIEVQDLVVSLPDISPGFHFPSGTVRFDGTGRGEISQFVGGPSEGGHGRIELSGFIDLAPLGDPDYDLVLVTQDMPYRYADTFNAPDIDLRLALRRTAIGRLLSGEVDVTSAFVEPTLLNFNAPAVPPPPALKSPFLESTALDVQLDLRGMRVKNEFTDLTLEGNSRLYGSFYKPRFQGEIHLLSGGRIIVLSREFGVTKGRIALDRLVPTHSLLDLAYDPLLLNPELDIEAMARVYSYDDEEEKEVTMTLRGTALQSQPRFSSPGLGDTEVISLVAFGSSRFRTDDLYTAAGQLLLGGQVSKVGLDEFSLLPSGTVMGSVGETSVRMGKFFSFPLPIWVRYETPTSLPSNGQVEVEYKLGPYLTIRASSQSEYNLYGAGVGVKKSF